MLHKTILQSEILKGIKTNCVISNSAFMKLIINMSIIVYYGNEG